MKTTLVLKPAAVWHDIPGFPLYSINKLGHIMYKPTKQWLTIGQQPASKYKIVRLRSDKRTVNAYYHRLLAITFIENPFHLPCVDHIDGNPKNNALSNLRWCTHAQNSYNKKGKCTSVSNSKGITWRPRTKKWAVFISTNGVNTSYGYFDDLEAAVQHRAALVPLLHGEFARDK